MTEPQTGTAREEGRGKRERREASPPSSLFPPSSYAERAAAHERDRARHARRAEWLSWLRVLVFLVAVLLAAGGLAATGPGVALFSGALVMVVLLFTAAARAQRSAARRAEWHRALAAVCEEGVARRDRQWDRLPAAPPEPVDAGHPYAGDLNVLGRASLLQLLGPLGASTGGATAARWLLAPAPPAEIRARQAAVAELAPMVEFREELPKTNVGKILRRLLRDGQA